MSENAPAVSWAGGPGAGFHKISRRRFVQGAGVAGLGLLAGCGRLPWQAPSPKVVRIGWLTTTVVESPEGLVAGPVAVREAFVGRLREYGYQEGQNLTLDLRWTQGSDAQLDDL